MAKDPQGLPFPKNKIIECFKEFSSHEWRIKIPQI